MQIGGLTIEQLPNPKIRRCYQDLIRKAKSITYKLDIINAMHTDLINKLPSISESDDIILAGEIADIFEKIYSCMEYVAMIFKELYRDRGEIQAKFHSLLQKTIKNKDTSSIYADKRIFDFVDRSLEWYAIVHDIRSEETHFSNGKIMTQDSKIFYRIDRQTGRETVYDLIRIYKKLPSEREVEYKLEVLDVTRIYLSFINSIQQLERIILAKNEV